MEDGNTPTCLECGRPAPIADKRSKRWRGKHYCCHYCFSKYRYENSSTRKRQRAVAGGEKFSVEEIAERDAWRCHLCGRSVDMRLPRNSRMGATIDHLIPIDDDGPHTRANVKLAHHSCNVGRRTGGTVQLLLVG